MAEKYKQKVVFSLAVGYIKIPQNICSKWLKQTAFCMNFGLKKIWASILNIVFPDQLEKFWAAGCTALLVRKDIRAEIICVSKLVKHQIFNCFHGTLENFL